MRNGGGGSRGVRVVGWGVVRVGQGWSGGWGVEGDGQGRGGEGAGGVWGEGMSIWWLAAASLYIDVKFQKKMFPLKILIYI